METMPTFDKKLKDAGPPTPSKLEAMELRVSEQHALHERMSTMIGKTSGGRQSGAQSRLSLVGMEIAKLTGEETSDSKMSVDLRGSWQTVNGKKQC